MGDTVQIPGGNSGVVRIHGKNKGVALTIDSSSHYCNANPIDGAKQVVCEVWRNLISVGATPVAITNCLNFGNPEKEKVMGQFIETIDGISQACSYLDFPVVSGNVSFYNETNDQSINPTPTIGGVGLIKNLKNMINKNFKEIGSSILVVGKTLGHLYQSEFFIEVLNFTEGPPPSINLFNEKNNGLSILDIASKNLANSIHDISAGGMLVCLSEMCMSGKIGAKIKMQGNNLNKYNYLFGEDQSRYIIEVSNKNLNEVKNILNKNNIFYENIGITQVENLEIENEFKININELNRSNTTWFENYFK